MNKYTLFNNEHVSINSPFLLSDPVTKKTKFMVSYL